LNITIIGMGKIGLPLAVYFSRKKSKVTGLDINQEVVDKINNAVEPFPGENELSKYLKKSIKKGSLKATSDIETAIISANVIIICIPLIIDQNNDPVFGNMDMVVENIGKFVQPGTVVIFETTLPVGTTRKRFAPILESISKLSIGSDLFVAFSPERVFTGRFFEDISKYPKIVGGVTPVCTDKAVNFYRQIIDFKKRPDLEVTNGVWPVKNSDTAEFIKIAETTYRDVNIGLANEFSLFAKKNDIDINEVISGANSQHFSHIHTPGISVGGHCIPVYPQFYLKDFSEAHIVKAARNQNLSMPGRAIEEIKTKITSLNNFSIGVLGISYRPGVKEAAFSGALEILKILLDEGADVYAFDPFFSKQEIELLGFKHASDYRYMHGLILHTSHNEFKEIDFNSIANLKFIYDGRNFYKNIKLDKNITYFSI